MSKDTIYRGDAIDVVTYPHIGNLTTEERIALIEYIPSAEPSVGYVGIDGDYLVSVKEVLNITAETGALETQRRVKELPRRDRPQGEWIAIGTISHSYKCSVCGRTLLHTMVGKNHVAKYYPYCHCGARMFAKDTNVPNKKGADDDID